CLTPAEQRLANHHQHEVSQYREHSSIKRRSGDSQNHPPQWLVQDCPGRQNRPQHLWRQTTLSDLGRSGGQKAW
ncbi:hypothetical protein CLAFUW4_04831, partial [Fulvia fulva]